MAQSPCSLHRNTAAREREHRARLAYIHTVLSKLSLVPRTAPAVDTHRLSAPVTVYVDDAVHGPAQPSSSTAAMERRAASTALGASVDDEAITATTDDDSCDSDSTGGPPPLVSASDTSSDDDSPPLAGAPFSLTTPTSAPTGRAFGASLLATPPAAH